MHERQGSGEARARALRTFVIAGARLYREGLAQVLARDPRIEVVGAAPNIAVGLLGIAETHPCAVLLDAGIASQPGAMIALTQAEPDSCIVAFGVADDEEEIVIRCAEAGVAGYVSCEAGVDELVAVVTSAIRDELVCSPRLAGTLLRRVGALARERSGGEPAVRLTARETQIVGLIDDGLSNKEIASRLHISLPTVKNHIHNLLEKLDATCRGEAAARVRALRTQMPDRISRPVG